MHLHLSPIAIAEGPLRINEWPSQLSLITAGTKKLLLAEFLICMNDRRLPKDVIIGEIENTESKTDTVGMRGNG